jgi:hypothetical protein
MCEGLKLTHPSLQTVISAHPSLRASKGKIYMLRDRDEVDCLLKQAFEEGVSWPIERSSLNVLADMSLTIEQIAQYFSVDPVEVRAVLKSGR